MPSTNTWLLAHCKEETYPNLFTVYTYRQTAGRGQAGNAWESEPGKNLSFSTLFHLRSAEQASRLNLLVPLAIVEAMDSTDVTLSIKWPNDIYFGDKKLGGILIENVFIGSRAAFAVAGIGLNINQELFVSDAPNPVSFRQITGTTYDLDALLDRIVEHMGARLSLLDDYTSLKQAYMARLYRRAGFFPYVERDVSTAPTTIADAAAISADTHQPFLAEIADIDPYGRLVLRRTDGTVSTYHFKQIRFVL